MVLGRASRISSLTGRFFGDGIAEFQMENDTLDISDILNSQGLIQSVDAADILPGLRTHVGIVEDVCGISRSGVDEKEVDGQQAKE